MNLVFLYGPPATGKLTIAKELSKLTGYRLFHNHLTLDLAREILPDFDERLFELTRKLRFDAFKAAAKYDRNLIFTYVYTGDDSEKSFVESVVKAVEQYNGKILFVQLAAPLETILSRVEDDSRKEHKKVNDREQLRSSLERYDMNVSVLHEPILKLDTSQLSPKESAQKIVEHFDLG
jgi:shikimate kinase